MFRSFLPLEIRHLAFCDALIVGVFELFDKFQLGINEIKLWRNHSICNFFEFYNIGQAGRKLHKFQYLKGQESILGEMKSIFHDILKTFFCWNIKKADKSFKDIWKFLVILKAHKTHVPSSMRLLNLANLNTRCFFINRRNIMVNHWHQGSSSHLL